MRPRCCHLCCRQVCISPTTAEMIIECKGGYAPAQRCLDRICKTNLQARSAMLGYLGKTIVGKLIHMELVFFNAAAIPYAEGKVDKVSLDVPAQVLSKLAERPTTLELCREIDPGTAAVGTEMVWCTREQRLVCNGLVEFEDVSAVANTPSERRMLAGTDTPEQAGHPASESCVGVRASPQVLLPAPRRRVRVCTAAVGSRARRFLLKDVLFLHDGMQNDGEWRFGSKDPLIQHWLVSDCGEPRPMAALRRVVQSPCPTILLRSSLC